MDSQIAFDVIVEHEKYRGEIEKEVGKRSIYLSFVKVPKGFYQKEKYQKAYKPEAFIRER